MYFLGIDVGGTKIEAMLLAFEDKISKHKMISTIHYMKKNGSQSQAVIISRKRMKTERIGGYDLVIQKIAQLIEDVCQENSISVSMLQGIGLSVPGPVDPVLKCITASNSMIMENKKIHEDVKNYLGLSCPVVMENDANCFALAEVYCGVGLDHAKKTGVSLSHQIGVGLILGSGVGGGVVLNGQIFSGRRGAASEVGHITLYAQGHPCYCGRRGCAEQYLCGPALEAAFHTRFYSQIRTFQSTAQVFELFQAKDPIALAVIKQYQRDLAFFLGNLVCLLDPDYFVLGGGLSLQDEIYNGITEKMKDNTLIGHDIPPVYKHKVGDSAGAVGAILPFVL